MGQDRETLSAANAATQLDDYRLYVIARHHFGLRSGIFSLDDLMDVLHAGYGYASLHHRPGNDRRRFAARQALRLGASHLFAVLPDGRYRINSERYIQSKYARSKKSGWYEIADPAVLHSRRSFYDFCVGALLAGNKFRANKNIANQCGCTVRRVQYATARNHRESRFYKQYNFVEDFTGTWEEVTRYRAILLNVHGITSPRPVRVRKGEYLVRLNAPNSYRSIALSGVKGNKAQPPKKTAKKEDSWFIPVPTRERQLDLFAEQNYRRWYFNEHVYNTDRYIQDNSALFVS